MNTGDVISGEIKSATTVGGVVGQLAMGNVYHCVNAGNVRTECQQAYDGVGSYYIGGVVGQASGSTNAKTIFNLWNCGTVTDTQGVSQYRGDVHANADVYKRQALSR